jgi:MFS family permease
MPHDNVAVFTGVAFAASGIANAVAAVFYSRLAARIGYRWVAAAGSLVAAGAIMLIAVAPNPPVVVVATLATGLVFGTLIPATSAMLGLEAPVAVQGTIFGFSASAVALGFGLGPLIGGSVAGVVNVEAGLATIAAVAVLLALLIAVGGREPAQ